MKQYHVKVMLDSFHFNGFVIPSLEPYTYNRLTRDLARLYPFYEFNSRHFNCTCSRFTEISKICRHSNYNHVTLDYDIALLRFESPLQAFNDTMSPVCLPTGLTRFPSGTYCWVTGFSKKRRTKRDTNLLRQAELPLQPLAYCRQQYPHYTITPRMLCAAFEDGGLDSCHGDSGGPLVCQEIESGKFVQIGVVSWASACAQPGQPGVYTNVKYLVPWINRIIR